eukprot:gnl/MRDRNA2_/MRDRNA2_145573_c0_seq1.p1 gnl/MRDRNA2_/MRDRNA2_145573_c0~~gnl/MRDRNA2_/MRDRNA2_145573_c0_seq1.p1  ORF type:complete len:257 (+),score=60.26 gnl/MRDRNA2_/MRDRNA2_145573_c0_seq1:114-884(+)
MIEPGVLWDTLTTGNNVQCTARMLNGETFAVAAKSGWTLFDVKRALCSKSGIPLHEQRLLKDSQEVSDRDLLCVHVSEGDVEFNLIRRNPEQASFLVAVRDKWQILKDANEEFRNDEEIVLAAVQQNGGALKYACKELRARKEIVLTAVQTSGCALEYASEDLRDQPEIALAAVKQNGDALRFVSQELKGSQEIVMAAVTCDGFALQYASEDLRDNPEIVLAAVKEDELALQYASEQLKSKYLNGHLRVSRWGTLP